MTTDVLKKQLEQARYERAVEIAESLADHRALLTTAELVRVNDVLNGKKPKSDQVDSDLGSAWRREAVTLTLPSGRTETLALIVDPVLTAREKLHKATETAESGDPVEAGIHLYVDLVLAHVFRDGNRRTASLASHYFFRRYGVALRGVDLYQVELGDLRQAGQIDFLRSQVTEKIKSNNAD